MNDKIPMINMRDVSVRYPSKIDALHDVSFTLGAGTICALVGANGAGKSTLFKTLMGFVKQFQGSVQIANMPVNKALKAGRVAYVPQNEDVDWNFPVLVRDVVMMGRYGHMGLMRIPRASDYDAVDAALATVNMEGFAQRSIDALSGGQKKRVFLARALAQVEGLGAPALILLDEPFTGVDVKTETRIVEVMRDLRAAGHTILVATHNLGSVPDYCDQVILLNLTVLAAGPTDEVFTQDNLALAFGGMLRQIHLEGDDLHDDADPRSVMVLTDDERPLVFYGDKAQKKIVPRRVRAAKRANKAANKTGAA